MMVVIILMIKMMMMIIMMMASIITNDCSDNMATSCSVLQTPWPPVLRQATAPGGLLSGL